jgi:hypothetical protein
MRRFRAPRRARDQRLELVQPRLGARSTSAPSLRSSPSSARSSPSAARPASSIERRALLNRCRVVIESPWGSETLSPKTSGLVRSDR